MSALAAGTDGIRTLAGNRRGRDTTTTNTSGRGQRPANPLPLYLQNVRSLSPLETGLLVMPGGLAMGLLGPSVGRVFDRFGARVLVIPGSIGILMSLAGFTQISMSMPYWQLLGLHAVLMVCLAGTFTPVFTLGLGALPRDLYSHGSSILGTLQQVAAAFGTALAVTVMTVRTEQVVESVGPVEAQLAGMKIAFAVSALISLVVIALAWLLPSRPVTVEPAMAEPDKEPTLEDELEHLSTHGCEQAPCAC